MIPGAYVDLEVLGVAPEGPGWREGAGCAALPVVQRMMTVLHGVFAEPPGRFALAFPLMHNGVFRHPGRILRVFAEQREELGDLCDELEGKPLFRDYVHIGRVRRVLENPSGKWIEYRRWRVPARNAEPLRRADAMTRQERLIAGAEMPFVRVRSRSNGHHFTLVLHRVEHSEPRNGTPNQYGLSSTTSSIALPDLVVQPPEWQRRFERRHETVQA
jgi:CRISPR-associated endoribonuclease Cas6/Csy4 subtype I-F